MASTGAGFGWVAMACAAVALCAEPAWAQTQTVAGAQQFLSITANQKTTTVDNDWGQGFNLVSGRRVADKCTQEYYYDGWGTRQGPRTRCWKQDEYSNVYRPAAQLVSAVMISDCLTEIEITEASTYAGGYQISALGTHKLRLDWAKIAKVQQSGNTVTVSPTSPGLRFRLSSDDLATRTTFAMEFIRQNCDPAAATGF